MPGDPKECREHARQCLKLADLAITPVARERFQDLAKTWLRLATDLETAQALLDDWGEEALKNKLKGP